MSMEELTCRWARTREGMQADGLADGRMASMQMDGHDGVLVIGKSWGWGLSSSSSSSSKAGVEIKDKRYKKSEKVYLPVLMRSVS